MSDPLLENDYLRLKRCRYGWMMYNINDTPIGRCLNIYGEWAQAEMNLLEQFISFGDTIIDVGAHVGPHTLFFAHSVGPSGTVFSLEPQKIFYQMLCGNLALNLVTTVSPINAAAGEKTGKTKIPFIDPHIVFNFGSIFAGKVHMGKPIPQIKLDSLPLSRCDLIKIDVEGAEVQVLKGAQKIIRTYSPVIYVENNNTERSSELIMLLTEYDYHCWWHIYSRFNPDNYFGVQDDRFAPGSVEPNMLCFPRSMNPQQYNLSQLHHVTGENDNWEKAWKRITGMSGLIS